MKNIFLACKAILALALAANCVHGYADSRIEETPASDSRICYTGRTVAEDGNVSFDWTGTDCRIRFSGPYLAVRCSDTKANYFNVWIDKEFSDKADKVIRTSGQEDISRIPDIVVIFLGSNDFSTGKQPRMQVFVERYLELVGKVRRNYGEDIPILCIASRTDPLLHSYISEACARDGRLSLCTMHEKSYSNASDLGASYHPNRIGQRKIASIVIPYISSITGWEMPVEPYL